MTRAALTLLGLLFLSMLRPDSANAQYAGDISAAVSAITNPDALTRTQASRNRDRTYVTDFCAADDLNGSNDNHVCIQAAINAICNREVGGGTLYLPASYGYAIDAAYGVIIPCSGVTIMGDGWGDRDHSAKGTLINVVGAGSSRILYFRVPAASMRIGQYTPGSGVRDLMIFSSNAHTNVTQTGAMIALEHCEGCLIQNVRIWGAYVGITSYAGLMNRVTQTQINQTMPAGVGIFVAGSDSGCTSIGNCSTRSDVFQIDHTILDATFGQGNQHQPDCIILRDFAATNLASNVICNQFRTGLRVDCPNSSQLMACPAFITVFDLEVESNARGQGDGQNIVMTDFQHFVCVACQLFGYDVVNNVALANDRFVGSGDAQIIGGKIGGATNSCIVSSVQRTSFGSGLTVQGCGNNSYGIDLRGASIGGSGNSGSQKVQGVDFCTDLNGTVPTSMRGILILPGQDYNVVAGNNFRGCLSGVTDNSSGAHVVVANNAGP